MAKGFFISFEGIDGCGKTTQLKQLSAQLRLTGRQVVETVEPGGTAAGRSIRSILLDPEHQSLDKRTEMLLYFASRAQNVAEIIRPALDRNAMVLCDRFTDSTIVYQGAGRGIDHGAILALHRIACGDLKPDMTLLLDIDLETSLHRASQRNRAAALTETRMDDQDRAFFERVQAGYRDLAAAEPNRIRLIDARGSIDVIAERIWNEVREHV